MGHIWSDCADTPKLDMEPSTDIKETHSPPRKRKRQVEPDTKSHVRLKLPSKGTFVQPGEYDTFLKDTIGALLKNEQVFLQLVKDTYRTTMRKKVVPKLKEWEGKDGQQPDLDDLLSILLQLLTFSSQLKSVASDLDKHLVQLAQLAAHSTSFKGQEESKSARAYLERAPRRLDIDTFRLQSWCDQGFITKEQMDQIKSQAQQSAKVRVKKRDLERVLEKSNVQFLWTRGENFAHDTRLVLNLE